MSRSSREGVPVGCVLGKGTLGEVPVGDDYNGVVQSVLSARATGAIAPKITGDARKSRACIAMRSCSNRAQTQW